MCYEVKCGKCGKTTWGGCGRHVASVHQRIAEGQHCMCRDWPGVKLAQSSGADAVFDGKAADKNPSSSSTCTIH
ncbi:hypothetical protein OPV22_027249 [Ensete ventricosum]|uniref:Uncharacterized protein n=1 Tax=Ensete ventricosum TaxID=4639 RepID=A0AAV8P555_ENSVE|nr:hypothetical protein OPV22_027249 [Ensete ventricosum]RWW64097.1 hypothetical protein BHE74_00028691 [Ensete ventricosum]